MRDGAAYLLDEIATADGPAEVLILGSGSQVPEVGLPAVPGRNGVRTRGNAEGAGRNPP